jgi:Tfp pilus assembly protein PilE
VKNVKKIKRKRGFYVNRAFDRRSNLGILIAIVIGATSGNKAAANDTKEQADLARIQDKLEEYYTDHQAYPAALADIALVLTMARLQLTPRIRGHMSTPTLRLRCHVLYSDCANGKS